MNDDQKRWNDAYAGRHHNTGKVQIGLTYVPPPQPIRSRDEERIQGALLAPEPAARKWADRALYAVSIVAVIVLGALPFLPRLP